MLSTFAKAHNDYLTPPDDGGYDNYCTIISEKYISDKDWEAMEDWYCCWKMPKGVNSDKALSYCWKRGYTPEEAAFYITRYFYRNVLKKLTLNQKK